MWRRNALLSAVGLIVWGCLVPAAHPEGGTLRVGMPSVPPALDPATAVATPARMLARQVFDTLVQFRAGSSDVEAALASQWTVSKNGLVWTFRLREGVRFHDGTALTSHHAVASIERQLFPGHPLAPAGPAVAPSLLRGAPGVVKEIRAPDARTIQIRLQQPYAPLPTALAHPALSIVLPAPDGTGRWLGTGPFSVAESTAGRLTLDANRAYWGGAPRVARVVFVEVSEDTRALADLDERALDVWLPAGASSRTAGAVSVPGWRIGFLAMQTEKEPFSRRKARQAVAVALDPERIEAALGLGAAALPSFLPPGLWGGGAPPGRIMKADAAAARRLLGEAGLPRGVTTSLLMVGGAAGDEQARLGEALRAMLAPAGIAVQPRPMPPDEMLSLAQNGEHQMALMEARAEGGDPHYLLYPLSTSEAAVKGRSAWNLSFYRNPRLDDLLIRASQLSFRPERQRVYERAQTLLGEEVPWLPLYVRRHWAVLRPEVKGLRLHPSGQHRFDRVTLEVR
ncbi:MAG TPA: ABC transporter substrate-binding protein [Candidatus Limnocylindrales bacterium]|nr:ABC transporter substrate-binding protein [Candidatus Limnocylindrales bacterium]